ncbi:16S rRNA (guanine(966)-N(2))-methyltransferase RsmD [Microlunatus elymi]|uniref:16S rRNA (Guanine(966)-N(2))-methyltransferase RsmD n=1 Tax=Microlunatus elymi TaxID=2596828 RepID=A0A516PYR1_9ACTN|nr:16S rRNA (guanine(966)-N(2))-methyltransferase RsmD [Microlunatus elymi]QDP96308.1 16S rRNA (guanine(966)-N(2))-methyltransferase RsmD [Microlunatus elymi]
MSRIIAGSRRGRRLSTPPGGRTRPTTDRVREALFAGLASWAGTAGSGADESLAGLAFLDLYAGSGAVGLEAASRGAARVMLVESDRRTARIIGDNARELDLPVQVRTGRVEDVIGVPPPGPYDVVFADPPYDVTSAVLSRQLAVLLAQGWLTDDALVIVERSSRTEELSWPEDPADVWSKDYGETVLWFWQR